MQWINVPYIFRLIVGIGIGLLLLKMGCALIGFLVKLSVNENPPAIKGNKLEQYMMFLGLQKFFLAIFYLGVILEVIFSALVINHISNASVGHLILFGSFTIIGLIGNVIVMIKRRQLKR